MSELLRHCQHLDIEQRSKRLSSKGLAVTTNKLDKLLQQRNWLTVRIITLAKQLYSYYSKHTKWLKQKEQYLKQRDELDILIAEEGLNGGV